MIAAVIERCAGIDVGVMTGPANGEARSEIRTFGTTVGELKLARAWITAEQCTHVILESTGTYWKPVFNILEGHVQVALANPQEVKARKGRQTDQKDAWWLAHLLRHGMATPSFIPPRRQRELRDLTRRRRKLIQIAGAEKNRVGKVLEDANIKLGSVLSDIFGASGQLMLEALLEGKADAAQIAYFARARAKKKIPALIAALEEHQMTDHHRDMISLSLEHMVSGGATEENRRFDPPQNPASRLSAVMGVAAHPARRARKCRRRAGGNGSGPGPIFEPEEAGLLEWPVPRQQPQRGPQ